MYATVASNLDKQTFQRLERHLRGNINCAYFLRSLAPPPNLSSPGRHCHSSPDPVLGPATIFLTLTLTLASGHDPQETQGPNKAIPFTQEHGLVATSIGIQIQKSLILRIMGLSGTKPKHPGRMTAATPNRGS